MKVVVTADIYYGAYNSQPILKNPAKRITRIKEIKIR